MFRYTTNTTYEDVARRVRSADRIALVTHAKPDGDALGTQLALHRAFAQIGIRSDIYVMGPIERGLLRVCGDTALLRAENEPPGEEHDLVLVVDTGAWVQLEPLTDWIRQRHERVIGLDHHARGDDVAAQRIVESDAAATSVLAVKLLEALGVDLTGGAGSVAEALFVALATDTGWFKYDNAGVAAFSLATRLLEAGVNKSRLYQILEENFTPSRVALEARGLSSLEFACEGAVAIQSIRQTDFAETGGTVEELTGLVNNPMSIGSVRVSILLAETKPGVTKISFRSKPPLDDGEWTDVNELARDFGGGGHVHAAGARMDEAIDEARRIVRETVEQ